MELKYRGIAYTSDRIAPVQPSASVEGNYHGIKTKIYLPIVVEGLQELKALMTYRGISLAA